MSLTGAVISAYISKEQLKKSLEVYKEARARMNLTSDQMMQAYEESFERDQELKAYTPQFLQEFNTPYNYEICETRWHRGKTAAFASIRPALEETRGVTASSQVGNRRRNAKRMVMQSARQSMPRMVQVDYLEKRIKESWQQMTDQKLTIAPTRNHYESSVIRGMQAEAQVSFDMARRGAYQSNSAMFVLGRSIDQIKSAAIGWLTPEQQAQDAYPMPNLSVSLGGQPQ